MIYLGEQNFDVDYVYSCLVFIIREGYVKPETLAIPSLQAMTYHKERI